MLIAKLLSGILVLAWLIIRPPFQLLSALVALVVRWFRGQPVPAAPPPRRPRSDCRSADLACHGSQTALHAALVAGAGNDPSRVRMVNADLEALRIGFGELEQAGRRVREIHANRSTMRQFLSNLNMSGASAYDRLAACCEGPITLYGVPMLNSTTSVPQGKMLLVGD